MSPEPRAFIPNEFLFGPNASMMLLFGSEFQRWKISGAPQIIIIATTPKLTDALLIHGGSSLLMRMRRAQMERRRLLDIGEILSVADHRLAFRMCVYRAAGGPQARTGDKGAGAATTGPASRGNWIPAATVAAGLSGPSRSQEIREPAAKLRRLMRHCHDANGVVSKLHGSRLALASVSHGATK